MNGTTISNNSYLSFRNIGRNWDETLTCDGSGESVDWYYPNREIVPQFSWRDSSIRVIPTVLYARKYRMTSYLFREGVPPLLGQYYCNTSDQMINVHIGKIHYKYNVMYHEGLSVSNIRLFQCLYVTQRC